MNNFEYSESDDNIYSDKKNSKKMLNSMFISRKILCKAKIIER